MSVAISRLERDEQQIATLADRETGRPDGQTSRPELEAFFKKYEIYGERDRERLLRAVDALELRAAITPERLTEIQDIVIDMARSNVRDWEAEAKKRGLEGAERNLAGGLANFYNRSVSNVNGRYSNNDFEDLLTDGDVSDADRARFTEWLRRAPDDPAGAERVGVTALGDVAEAGARRYRAMHAELLANGLVPGGGADGALSAPSPEVRLSMRDGTLFRKLRDQQRAAARDLVTRHPVGWFRPSWFVQQLDVAAVTKELVANWDTPRAGAVSSQRQVQELLASGRDAPLEDSALRSEVAGALMGRLSDAQVAALDFPTAAVLLASLKGGDTPSFENDNLTNQERSSGYILSRPTSGPRVAQVSDGKGSVHTAQIERLRRLTGDRFEFVPNPSYRNYLKMRER